MPDEQQGAKRTRPPYPVEVRERAAGMVLDHQGEYPSQWKAVESIAKKIGVNHETLRMWMKQAQIDAGTLVGATSAEKDPVRQLERENKELRRANEILKAAASFFGAKLDRQSQK